METPATYNGRAANTPRTHRQHRDAIDAAQRVIYDHDMSPGCEPGTLGPVLDHATRHHLLDVAGLTRNDLDDATVTWLDSMLGQDADAVGGGAALVDAATTK